MTLARGRSLAVVLAACALYLGAGVACIRHWSPTYDEAAHLVAGYTYLTRKNFRLDQDVPPLSKVMAALPVILFEEVQFEPEPEAWKVGDQFALGNQLLFRSGVAPERLLLLARLPNLMLGLGVLLLTGWWARRLWGSEAGVVALALAASDPNLLAHSCLVTADTAATFFTLVTAWLLWEWTRAPSTGGALLAGVASGLAMASKFSCLLLLPAVLLTGILAGRRSGVEVTPRAALPSDGLAFGLGAALTIPPFYAFTWWGGYGYWLIGLDLFIGHARFGHPTYLMGEHSLGGFWSYYPLVLLTKTPLGTLAAVALSAALLRGTRPAGRELVSMLPIPLLFLASCVFARVQLGVRHLLPVYPFLWLLAARLANPDFAHRQGIRLFAWIAVLATLLSSFVATPHQLAYFNEAAGGGDRGAQLLADSNLDWGQELSHLAQWVRQEGSPVIYLSYYGTARPASYGIRYLHLPGDPTWSSRRGDEDPPDDYPLSGGRELLAIGVTNLQGLWPPSMRDYYGWLLGREPVARLGHAIYVYDITGDAAAHLKIAEVFLRCKKGKLAARELRRALALDGTLTLPAGLLERLEAAPRLPKPAAP